MIFSEIVNALTSSAPGFSKTLQTYVERASNIGSVLHATNALELLDAVLSGIDKPKMKESGYYTQILENISSMQNFQTFSKLHEIFEKYKCFPDYLDLKDVIGILQYSPESEWYEFLSLPLKKYKLECQFSGNRKMRLQLCHEIINNPGNKQIIEAFNDEFGIKITRISTELIDTTIESGNLRFLKFLLTRVIENNNNNNDTGSTNTNANIIVALTTATIGGPKGTSRVMYAPTYEMIEYLMTTYNIPISLQLFDKAWENNRSLFLRYILEENTRRLKDDNKSGSPTIKFTRKDKKKYFYLKSYSDHEKENFQCLDVMLEFYDSREFVEITDDDANYNELKPQYLFDLYGICNGYNNENKARITAKSKLDEINKMVNIVKNISDAKLTNIQREKWLIEYYIKWDVSGMLDKYELSLVGNYYVLAMAIEQNHEAMVDFILKKIEQVKTRDTNMLLRALRTAIQMCKNSKICNKVINHIYNQIKYNDNNNNNGYQIDVHSVLNTSDKLNIKYLRRVAKAYHRDKQVVQGIDNLISISENQLKKSTANVNVNENTKNEDIIETKTDDNDMNEITVTTENKSEEKEELNVNETNDVKEENDLLLLEEWNDIGKKMQSKYGCKEHAILNSRIDTSLLNVYQRYNNQQWRKFLLLNIFENSNYFCNNDFEYLSKNHICGNYKSESKGVYLFHSILKQDSMSNLFIDIMNHLLKEYYNSNMSKMSSILMMVDGDHKLPVECLTFGGYNTHYQKTKFDKKMRKAGKVIATVSNEKEKMVVDLQTIEEFKKNEKVNHLMFEMQRQTILAKFNTIG